jgi:hypothetical protein
MRVIEGQAEVSLYTNQSPLFSFLENNYSNYYKWSVLAWTGIASRIN